MNSEFYVYLFLDPRHKETWCANEFVFDYRPLYVGKGKGFRVFEHLWENAPANQCNPILHAVLQKLRTVAIIPIIKLVQFGLSEQQAFRLESKLIKTFGRRCAKDGPLANLTLGGEGQAGRIRPLHERAAISAALRGKKKPPHFSALLSARCKGKPLSIEHRAKLSASHKGYKATPEQRAKLSAARKAEWASGQRKGTPGINRKGSTS